MWVSKLVSLAEIQGDKQAVRGSLERREMDPLWSPEATEAGIAAAALYGCVCSCMPDESLQPTRTKPGGCWHCISRCAGWCHRTSTVACYGGKDTASRFHFTGATGAAVEEVTERVRTCVQKG